MCDESTKTADGTEPRYTLNGAYDLSESPASVLDNMHKCIAAEPTYIAGKHGILMQSYNGPATLRIEANQIIDTVNITLNCPCAKRLMRYTVRLLMLSNNISKQISAGDCTGVG
ncbi:hypothetical protein [Arsenophonus nasoniae]|uniref:Uncharacterized protein n=1 Tax=Arsenophonus nasoniae TaxID=638 RepID=A0A4P7KSY3_9GAMM|nr:hypothetical protein [Arsenophonus nasoniae]QBY42816.1 hypothetical protein ArsFIN_13760 [Arsenophonus nasoniae]